MSQMKLLDAYVEISARGVGALSSQLRGVEQAAGRAYGVLSNISQIAIGNAAAQGISALLSAVSQVPSRMISASAEYEKASVTLEVLLGSAEAARQRIADLNKFGAETPFELPGVLQASKQLEMSSVPAKDHMKVLRMTGEMASAAGVDISELGMWVSRAYANIQGGKPWGEAAMRMNELGVLSVDARARLEALADSGASATEVWAAFQQEMGRFDGMMMKQSQTFLGLASTLNDSISQSLMVFGAPLFEAVKQGLQGVVGLMGSADWTSGVAAAGQAMADGFAAVGQWVAPLVDDVVDLMSAVWNFVGSGESLGWLGSMFDYIGQSAQAGFELLTASATAVFEIVSALGSAIYDGVVWALGLIGVTASDASAMLEASFSALLGVVDGIAASIRNWDLSIQYAWLSLQNFASNAYAYADAIGQNFVIVFRNLPLYVEAGAQAAVTILGNLAANIGIAFSSVFDWIAGWFKGGSGGWGEAIGNAIQSVWDGIKWLLSSIASGLKSVWDAVVSGVSSGLDMVQQNYAQAILNGTKNADGSIAPAFIPLTQGVAEAFSNLPELVRPITQSVSDQFGSEMAALDAEWNRREKDRTKRESENRSTAQAVTDRMRPEMPKSPEVPTVPTSAPGSAEASKSKTDSRSERSAGDLIGAADLWQRLAKASMESKPAEKIAKDQLDVTKQIAKGIREIADAGLGGAATFA
jgi:hypothetical protein